MNVPDPQRMPRSLWWMLAALSLAWGLNWTGIKIGLAGFTPWTFRSLCLGFGAVLLFLLARGAGQRLSLPRAMWARLAVLAFFNVSCWNMLIAFGLTMIPSGRAAILAYTMPVWSVTLSVWLLRERLTGPRLTALALGMSGMGLLLGEELTALGRAPLGALLVLGAALSWGIGTVLQKRWMLGLPMGTFTAWTMFLGGLPIFAGTLLFEWGVPQAVGLGPALALAYNVVVAFAFAYWVWFRIASAVPVAVSSISVLCVPIIGVLSGIVFLGERPSLGEVLALFLVVAAVFIVNLPPKR